MAHQDITSALREVNARITALRRGTEHGTTILIGVRPDHHHTPKGGDAHE